MIQKAYMVKKVNVRIVTNRGDINIGYMIAKNKK